MFRIRGQLPRVARATRSISTTVVDNSQPVSEVSLVLNGGSRYEQVPGAAHLLQRFAFKDTQNRTGLRLQREAELLGGKLSTELSRDHLVLTATFLREDLPYFVEALADAVSKPLFKPHEYTEEVVPLVLAEAKAARSTPLYLAVERAHEVAFRSGLGAPLLASPEFPASLEEVKAFAAQVYAQPAAALFARNVAEADLKQFADADFAALPGTGAPSASKPTFYSGNVRTAHPTAVQTAVLAFPTEKKADVQALKYVLGGRNIKWSKSFGLLNGLDGVSTSVHHKVYADAGLLYVTLQSSSAEKLSAAITDAAATIAKLGSGVDAQVASKAVATAKFAAAEKQGTLHGFLKPALDVSSTTPESIAAAAKALVAGPKVLSVVGRTFALPHLEDLF